MSRQYTQFDKFPGQIVNGRYEYPVLYTKDTAGRIRSWALIIRAIKCTAPNPTDVGWDPAANQSKCMAIEPAHIIGEELLTGYCVEAYVETGLVDGQITRHAPTRYEQGVNIGKKNYRTALQKALIDTRDSFIKRQETGGRFTVEEARDTQSTVQNAPTNTQLSTCLTTTRYFPMLAHNYKDSKKYAQWPAFIQPKLDGVRCITFIEGPGDECSVISYSRKLNDFTSIPHIAAILKPYLQDLYDVQNGQSIYLDGEVYEHGTALQDITGQVRQQDPNKVTALLSYYLYDCFYPLELNTPCDTRLTQLNILREALEVNPEHSKYVKFVPTEVVANEVEAQAAFRRFTDAGYEGAMLRNSRGPYLADPARVTTTRSRDLLKMKFKDTAEFKIMGFVEGKGRDSGAIIWQLETAAGVQFNCTPKDMTIEARRVLYKECLRNFQTTYLGRQMTVEYEALSNKGVPLRAKAVSVRDYE